MPYEVSISYDSKVMAKVQVFCHRVTERVIDKQDKKQMPLNSIQGIIIMIFFYKNCIREHNEDLKPEVKSIIMS